MTEPPIPVPAELAGKVPTGFVPLPLVGPDGQLVGYVVSPDEYRAGMKARALAALAQITDEEVARIRANPKRHTMAEVFALFEAP